MKYGNHIYQRLSIFTLAAFVRAVLGYIFYGSIDVSAFIGINAHTLNGTLVQHPPAIWCSFPVIPFYLWFCGLLGINTSLPLAFCFKIVPIFFDALLAVLLYDLMMRIRPAESFKIGMLYALSPVALIITCIHGQWEAVSFFFFLLALYIRTCYVPSYISYFCYGLFFAFSFMLKPFALVLSLLFFVPIPSFKQQLGVWWRYLMWLLCAIAGVLGVFFLMFKMHKSMSLDVLISPWIVGVKVLLLGVLVGLLLKTKPWSSFSLNFKRNLSLQLMAVAGLLSMVIFILLAFTVYGFNVFRMIDKILRYFNNGIQMFGLPYAWPFTIGPCALILKNRFWIMGVLALFAYLYYRCLLDIYYAVLCLSMFIFSVSGLSPQYLFWVIPLLLITGFYRVAALFNIVCTVFFVMYYLNPLTNPDVPYQSMLSFAALKPYAWLMPPEILTRTWSLPWIWLLGNYVIPLLCLSVVAWIMIHCRAGQCKLVCKQEPFVWFNGYLLISALVTGLIAMLMATVSTVGWAARFKELITQAPWNYAVVVIDRCISGAYGPVYWWNIGFVLIVGALVWGVVVYKRKLHV